ncbi:hypothetical protein [Pseudomonas nicosulfuronedens]
MKKVALIVAVIVLFAAWHGRSERQAVDKSLQVNANVNGFVDLTVNDQSLVGAGIVILAPLNCPQIEAQRADSLARALKERDIPFRRSNTINSNISIDSRTIESNGQSPEEVRKEYAALMAEKTKSLQAKVDLITAMGKQPAPVVFVNGKAKSNPSLEEVIAEYGRAE